MRAPHRAHGNRHFQARKRRAGMAPSRIGLMAENHRMHDPSRQEGEQADWILPRLCPTPFGHFKEPVKRRNSGRREVATHLHPHPVATSGLRSLCGGCERGGRVAITQNRELAPAIRHASGRTGGPAAGSRKLNQANPCNLSRSKDSPAVFHSVFTKRGYLRSKTGCRRPYRCCGRRPRPPAAVRSSPARRSRSHRRNHRSRNCRHRRRCGHRASSGSS